MPGQRSSLFFDMQYPEVPPAQAQNSQPRYRVASTWQAGLSLLASVFLLALALLFLLRGLGWISDSTIPRDQITSSFLLAASLALGGILLLPSAAYALARLVNRPVGQPRSLIKTSPWVTILILGTAFVLLTTAGAVAAETAPLDWVVLPFIHILVIAIPIITVLYLGGRGLSKGSPQRAWGIFSAGMTLGPIIAFPLEIAALITSIIAGVVALAFSPGQIRDLTNLLDRLQTANQSPDAILPLLQPYLKYPAVVLGILAFMAVIVPLLEEAIKPIGVWLLVKHQLTPAEGFTAGLISGAGFALVESLGYTSNGGSAWLSSVLLRAPTGLMHMLACGLTGWGLAKAVSLHRTRWFLAGYGGAVTIHGLWNGLTVTATGIFLIYPNRTSSYVIAGLAGLGLFTVFATVFILLVSINHRLRQEQIAHAIITPAPVMASAAETIPSESESPLNEHHP